MLPVSAPFHCSQLRPVEEKLEKALEGIEIMDAVIPVIANVTATEETRSDLIKGNMVKQVSRPVLWEESVIRMS